ncbi:MAG: hypothetical protein PUF08_06090 [Clostridiales bacterium]|nr:hypothetical protein [Clostridiales bacterium]
MRKIAASLLAAACAFTSATAVFAANQDVYYSNDNSVQINNSNIGADVNTYKTVLIRKTPNNPNAEIVEDEVVYINQNSSGLGALSSFMLKSGAAPGNYTATFGNDNGDVKEIQFVIYGQDENVIVGSNVTGSSKTVALDPDNKMNVVEDAVVQNHEIANDLDEGLYTKTFRFLNSGTSLNRIYLVSEDGTKCYGYFDLTLPETTGVTISYGIKLYNITNDKLGMNVYLAEKTAQEGTE